MFCHQHDFFLRLIDVGVDHDFPADIIDPEHYDNLRVEFPIYNHKIAYGTKNFRYEAAMSQEEFDKAANAMHEELLRLHKLFDIYNGYEDKAPDPSGTHLRGGRC